MVQLGIGGQGGVDRAAGPQHDPAALRAGQDLGPGPPLEQDEISRRTGPEAAGLGQAHDRGWGGGDGGGPVVERVVELADPHCLLEDLVHVEVTVGAEGVAGIVAGEGQRDATGLDFVDQRDAAPARGAARLPALQIEVAHRQADDGDSGLGD